MTFLKYVGMWLPFEKDSNERDKLFYNIYSAFTRYAFLYMYLISEIILFAQTKDLKVYNSFLYSQTKYYVLFLFLIGNNKYPFLVDDQHCVMLQNNKLWEQQKSYPTTCSLHWFTGFLASNSGRERVCFRSIAFSNSTIHIYNADMFIIGNGKLFCASIGYAFYHCLW